jgi:hypothetical protein
MMISIAIFRLTVNHLGIRSGFYAYKQTSIMTNLIFPTVDVRLTGILPDLESISKRRCRNASSGYFVLVSHP